MLTPLFSLSQDDKYLFVKIKAPYSKVSDADIEFGGRELFFSSAPYFLRLYLPKELAENGEESATYNADIGSFEIRAPKAVAGEEFAGLDMVTKLLTPPGRDSAAPIVEEIQLPSQTLPDDSDVVSASSEGYGFGGQKSGVVASLRAELGLLFELEAPDGLSRAQRAEAAAELEEAKFDENHYLADLFGLELGPMLELRLPWEDESWAELSAGDVERLKELPKRRPPHLCDDERAAAVATIAEILFGYAYELRTTDGEGSVESGWTVARLSSALSCLVRPDSLEAALRSSVRRALAYPLYRHVHLAHKVLADVAAIFCSGRVGVLKALVWVHATLAGGGDYRYLLNELFVTDALLWVQFDEGEEWATSAATRVNAWAKALRKEDLGFGLEEIELSARLAQMGTEPTLAQTETISDPTMLLEEIAKHAHKAPALDSDDSDDGETNESDHHS